MGNCCAAFANDFKTAEYFKKDNYLHFMVKCFNQIASSFSYEIRSKK